MVKRVFYYIFSKNYMPYHFGVVFKTSLFQKYNCQISWKRANDLERQ